MTTKNLLGKSRPQDKPYAVFKGHGPFGETEMRLLKTYQRPDKEKSNKYARWFVAVKTDMTYISEATYGLTLTWADPLYKEQYWDSNYTKVDTDTFTQEDDALLQQLGL
jgi:hypothetical protein